MVVKRSHSRAISGANTAELEVMPWKNSINGPLPASRTFREMRSVPMRRELSRLESMSVAMSKGSSLLLVFRKRII